MGWFKKLSARVKLILAFAAVSFVLSGVAGYALYQLSRLNDSVVTLHDRDIAGMRSAYDTTIYVLRMGRALRTVASREDRDAIDALEKQIRGWEPEIKAALDKLEPTLITEEGRAMTAKVREALVAYFPPAYETIRLQREGQKAQAAIEIEKVRDAANTLDQSCIKLVSMKQEIAEKTVKAAEDTYAASWYIVITSIIAGAAGALLLGYLVARWFATALIEVASIADSVAGASQELAAAAEELSSGAQEQASSLEETSSSLEQITSTIQQNADNAQQANQLATGSRDVAEKGGSIVGRAVTGMSEINTASKKIADIITAIDEIAFQTNLLALNAAVEAARAGEQGRGFAVVAGEVRNLAQRSAAAAKEIKGLIQDSVGKVEAGSKLVNQSGQSLDEIVGSVKRVTDIVSEIAAASREQATGIEQVNKAVTQMDHVTQSNASQTEELSGTAESLAAQAAHLQEVVAQFNLVKPTAHHATVRSNTSAKHFSATTPTRATRKPVAISTKKPAAPRPSHDDMLEDHVEKELATMTGSSRNGFEEF